MSQLSARAFERRKFGNVRGEWCEVGSEKGNKSGLTGQREGGL